MPNLSLLAKFGADTSAYEKGLKVAEKKTNSFSKSIGKQFLKIGAMFGGINVVKNILDMGMASQETANLFNTVFSDSVEEMTQNLERLHKVIPETRDALMENMAIFRQMGEGMGMTGKDANEFSMHLIQMGADLSSFFNMRPEHAFNKLRSAIAGMSRPMQDLGIDTKVARLETEAQQLGIEKINGEFTQQQKAILTLVAIQKQMGKSTGDQARTLESTSNQFKMLTRTIKDIASEMGVRLDPIIANLIGTFNKLAKFIGNNQKAILGIIGVFAKFFIAVKSAGMATKLFILLKINSVRTMTAFSLALKANRIAIQGYTMGLKGASIATKMARLATTSLNLSLKALKITLMKFGLPILFFGLTELATAFLTTAKGADELSDSIDDAELESQLKKANEEMAKFAKEVNKANKMAGNLETAEGNANDLADALTEVGEAQKDVNDEMDKTLFKQEKMEINALELEAIIARANGDDVRADKIMDVIDNMKRAIELAEKYNITIEEAIGITQKEIDLRSDDEQRMKHIEQLQQHINELKLEALRAEAQGEEELLKKLELRIKKNELLQEIMEDHNLSLIEARELVEQLVQERAKAGDDDFGDVTVSDTPSSETKERINENREKIISDVRAVHSDLLDEVATEISKQIGQMAEFKPFQNVKGEDVFRRHENGKITGTFTEDQLRNAIFKELESRDGKGAELLADILKTIQGRLTNES